MYPNESLMKPPPCKLPLCLGLCLYLLGVLCASFRQDAIPFAPLPATDTLSYHLELIPATSTVPAKLSISTTTGVPANIRIEWQVFVNGLPGQKGLFPAVSLLPRHPTLLRLALKSIPAGQEAWLRVTCRHAHAVFTQLLPLSPWRGDAAIPPTGELTFNDSNNIFTIIALGTLIEFDKQSGWLLHYEAGHVLLMGDTAGVQPTLWPMIPPRLQLFSTSTGPQLVIVRAEYTIPETASLLHLSYTINSAGDMLVSQTLEADTLQHLPDSVHLPPLPGFGMHWLLPPGLDTLTSFGAADPAAAPPLATASLSSSAPSATSYSSPAAPGISHRALTPGIATRETRWLTITGHDGAGIRIAADSTLLATGTIAFTDSTTHATRLVLLLNNPSDSLHHYMYKLSPVPAKPF
jgi:hypothetical protein